MVSSSEDTASRLLSALPARFQPIRLLGEGAQKSVHLAYDSVLQRDVAIAALDTETLGKRKEGLLREARIMARVGGRRHVVTIYDVIDAGGAAFIVSQFMPGGDVESELTGSPSAKLSPERVVAIGMQVCEALEAAHRLGVLHLDLKPANILLDLDRDAFLNDFGLARFASQSAGAVGMLMGTPTYFAPEQSTGDGVDFRSDLYALGSVLYELLLGLPPFVAPTAAEVVWRKLEEEPVAAADRDPSLPVGLSDVLAHLLRRDPDARPESAAAVHYALSSCLSRVSAPAQAGERIRLPGVFAATPEVGFFGREAPLSRMLDAWTGMCAERQPAVFGVSADAGMGKTRLAREFANRVHAQGATVLLGGASEGMLVAYQPLVEALRGYARSMTPEVLRSRLLGDADGIERFLPEMARKVDASLVPEEDDRESQIYQMFNAVVALLTAAATDAPLLLVLEDLHWADKSTLILLQHVLHFTQDVPVFVLMTYRGGEIADSHPLNELLADLHRRPTFGRIELSGLDDDDVASLVGSLTKSTVPGSFVTAIRNRTEGNPFFVAEIVRHLLESDGRISSRGWSSEGPGVGRELPVGVREVVGARIGRLGEESIEMLEIAAIIGRTFDLDILCEVGRVSMDVLLEQIAPAESGLVGECPDTLGSYQFVHGLIRETLYSRIPRARRIQIHRRIAAALELRARDRSVPVSDLAYHLSESAQPGDQAKIIRYSLEAAEAAAHLLAYQEAAAHYGRALRALDTAERSDDSQRCEILLSRADALWNAGETATSRELALQAAETARRIGEAELLARAALAAGGKLSGLQTGLLDEQLVSLLEDGLVALGEEDSPIRARVMARLAEALTFVNEAGVAERRQRLARDAMAMARGGDLISMAEVLRHAHWALWAPNNADERLEISDQMVQLAEAADAPGLALSGRGWRLVDLMELGKVDEFERELEEYEYRANQLRRPMFFYVTNLRRLMLATHRGRLEEIEALTMKILTLGEEAQVDSAVQAFGLAIFLVRRLQGRLEELEDTVLQMREHFPLNAGWSTSLAVIYNETGRLDEARAELSRIAANDFDEFPRDITWNVIITILAPVCAAVGDRRVAKLLYDELVLSADRCVVVAGTLFLGPAALWLGMLSRVLGDWDLSERWLQQALAESARIAFVPGEAMASHEYAATLRGRDGQGDSARADVLDSKALEIAESLGMDAMRDRIRGGSV